MVREPRLLSELGVPELEWALVRVDHPKWSELCRLRLLGFPTLNAVYVPPGSSTAFLCAAVNRLASVRAYTKLLLRSDGGVETSDYIKGGNTLPLPRLCEVARQLLDLGRAVVVLEPTNRFINELSLNLLCVRQGAFGYAVYEMLGPGYDVSDLNRGGIAPRASITFRNIDWTCHQYPSALDMHVSLDLDETRESTRRRQRLFRIGSDILPQMGIPATGKPEEFAACWLREQGFAALWRPWTPRLERRDLKHLFDDAFSLASGVPTTWTAFSCSASDLGDGRLVYWDIVNGARKWARPSR